MMKPANVSEMVATDIDCGDRCTSGDTEHQTFAGDRREDDMESREQERHEGVQKAEVESAEVETSVHGDDGLRLKDPNSAKVNDSKLLMALDAGNEIKYGQDRSAESIFKNDDDDDDDYSDNYGDVQEERNVTDEEMVAEENQETEAKVDGEEDDVSSRNSFHYKPMYNTSAAEANKTVSASAAKNDNDGNIQEDTKATDEVNEDIVVNDKEENGAKYEEEEEEEADDVSSRNSFDYSFDYMHVNRTSTMNADVQKGDNGHIKEDTKDKEEIVVEENEENKAKSEEADEDGAAYSNSFNYKLVNKTSTAIVNGDDDDTKEEKPTEKENEDIITEEKHENEARVKEDDDDDDVSSRNSFHYKRVNNTLAEANRTLSTSTATNFFATAVQADVVERYDFDNGNFIAEAPNRPASGETTRASADRSVIEGSLFNLPEDSDNAVSSPPITPENNEANNLIRLHTQYAGTERFSAPYLN